MNIKKIFSVMITAALLLSMTVTAFSSVTTVSEGDGSTVKISGVSASGVEGIPVAVDVFAPGKSYSDLDTALKNKENPTTVLANRFEVVTGEKGAFEHTIRLEDDPAVEGDAVSGVYTVVVWPMDSEASESTTFLYTNLDDMEKNFKAIKDAASADALLEILDENVYGVGVPYAFYEKADKGDIAKMVYDYIDNNAFDVTDIEGCTDVMKKAALIYGLTTGDVVNAFEYAKELEIGTSDIGDFYEKEYAVPLYVDITKDFKGESVESFDEFYELLNEAFVLAVVEKPDGVGNAKEVIDAFSDELGIKTSGNINVYREVADKSYSSMDALADAYKKAYKDKEGSGSGSSSGSGGGRGNSSGGSVGNYGVSSDMLEADTKGNTMPMDIFTDLGSVEWAKEAIVYLAEKGIVSGKGENLYYPDDNITREEFTKIVVGAFFGDAEEKEHSFVDVKSGEWYEPFIKKGYNEGIINGHSETMFGVGENITREDMVVILYRVALKKGMTEETEISLNFEDGAEIADYAKSAVAAMADMEIVNGRELGIFAPKGFATRAETAKMIYRLIMKQ